jgi:hypothetical protein
MPSRGQQLGKLLNPTGDIVETSLPPKIETFSQSVSDTGKVEKAALGNDVATIEEVSDITLLTASGNSVGDQRVVGNNLYIWNGSGWFRIALINETPTWDSGGQPLSSYDLSSDSPQTATTITLAATDPDGFPINYSYTTGGSMDSIGTISQDSSVFTITPKTEAQAPDGGTGTITFRASDGINIIPQVSSFTLSFGWSQQAKLQSADIAAGDTFGYSVSISNDGNTAIAGAWGEDTTASRAGSVYIFTRSGTTWTQQAKLQASDAATNNFLGWSVSISDDGNTAIAGARSADHDPWVTNSGAAYIFTRSGITWSQQAKLEASDIEADDSFGWSVSISGDGDTVIIGAPDEDISLPNEYNSGSAYIFTRSGTSWSQQAKIRSTDIATQDQFGYSVSISNDGDTAIIGAHYEDPIPFNSGAAYIFTRSGTNWSQQAKLVASDAANGDQFGKSVYISGDGNTAISGAYLEDTTASNAGSAYIFTRSGASWSQQAKIQAEDADASDAFGQTVSISNDGNTAVISATADEEAGAGAGSAYIFTRSGTTWSQQSKIIGSDAEAGDDFGRGVSISGDGYTVIIGAPYEDTNGSSAGSVYIFTI